MYCLIKLPVTSNFIPVDIYVRVLMHDVGGGKSVSRKRVEKYNTVSCIVLT